MDYLNINQKVFMNLWIDKINSNHYLNYSLYKHETLNPGLQINTEKK